MNASRRCARDAAMTAGSSEAEVTNASGIGCSQAPSEPAAEAGG